MSSRPRRSAARRATEAITDMADRDNERTMSSRSRRAGESRSVVYAPQGGPSPSPTSSPAESDRHGNSHARGPSSKLRQATAGKGRRNPSSRAKPDAGEAASSRRVTRGPKKSYVVASDSDEEDDEDEGEDEIEVGNVREARDDDDDEDEEENEDMRDVGDDDAEADDDMDVDAPADGDADSDMDVAPPPPPAVKVSKPAKGSGKGKAIATTKSSTRAAASVAKAHLKMTKDDDDSSDLDSDGEEAVDETVEVAGGDEDAEADEDMDVDGGEIEVADDDVGGANSDDDDRSRAETPDMSRMTARQRAKHGDATHEYLKLSDEVQVKKHLTAEELSMRRLEMARRRRNLSEKRNEEVKMETINKLLKKQAPKTNRRTALLAGEDTPEERASPLFVRFVSNKDGVRIGVPDDMVAGPMSHVFGIKSGGMVEDVL